MRQFSYNERDFTFGQTILTLRTNIGLTQTGLAEYLGVSRRAVGDWETGNKYPKAENLKQFIVLAIEQQAFEVGCEIEEVRTLWRAARQKVLLDENWLARLLASAHTTKNITVTTPAQVIPFPTSKGKPQVDWDEALSVPAFYGREQELRELRYWIVEERCRIVEVHGFGGIGKSALAINLMHSIAHNFEVVIWRSLRDAPTCEALLESCLQILAPHALNEEGFSLETRLSLLLEQVRNRRILLVLDNLEALLADGNEAGYMRSGYEDYGRLFRLLSQTNHQSCVLLTSREKPTGVIPFEGRNSPVRVLRLAPLSLDACAQLLLDKGVAGTPTQRERLSEIFGGNPLALKIVSQTIVDLFEGEIAPFLRQGQIIFGGVRELFEQQFARLSPLEKTVIKFLAILREPATLDELMDLPVKPAQRLSVLEAVEALYHRALIERGVKPGSFTVQAMVLEYVATHLIEFDERSGHPNIWNAQWENYAVQA